MAVTCHAQTFTVQVDGLSTTQAVLSYTAPNNSACRIRVSEQPGFAPLVHDVDPSLFSGADSDLRPGNLFQGTSRVVVIGKRSSELAADQKIYSRALQAYTTHYFRITCGRSVSTGSFQTKNIPFGVTYQDLPPEKFAYIDSASPVIDPQTGALIRVATPLANNNSDMAFLAYGGFYRVCSSDAVGPDNGYLCAFPVLSGGAGVGYYYVPSTGEMRYLGQYFIPGSAGPDGWDGPAVPYPLPGRTLYFGVLTRSGKSVTLKGTYYGNFQSVARGSFVQFDWQPIHVDGGSVSAALTNFFPSIVHPESCGISHGEGAWLFVTCQDGWQDTYPYAVGVIDAGTGMAIAARNMMTESPTRFCGDHNFHFLPPSSGIPLIEFGFHGLGGAGGRGSGPYVVTLAQAVDPAADAFIVSGEPQAPFLSDLPMTAQVGDIFDLVNPFEGIQIIQKLSSTQWRVKRQYLGGQSAVTRPAGTSLTAECGVSSPGVEGWPYTYWKFLEDPLGKNLVVNRAWPADGHDDSGLDLHLTEGYMFRRGFILDTFGLGPDGHITAAPTFAGVRSFTMGTSTGMHPSYHQTNDSNWFSDSRPFIGGNLYSDTHTNVGGQLYQYTFASVFPGIRIHQKTFPILSISFRDRLVDVSGPKSFISTGPDMPKTFCVALVDTECRQDSRAGWVYANIPSLAQNQCGAGVANDWCVLDNPPLGNVVLQVGITANNVALAPDDAPGGGLGWTRVLSRGLDTLRAFPIVAKPTPDGKWMFFNAANNLVMLKMPPFAKEDNVDRSSFVPVTVEVTPQAQAVAAVVEFGYVEYGLPDQYYCGSRRESCVAVESTVNTLDPFKFKDTEQYSGVPCASGCTITIPLAPQHVAYLRVLYLDSNGNVVATGPTGIATETVAVFAVPKKTSKKTP
jgi:hypothetical protein